MSAPAGLVLYHKVPEPMKGTVIYPLNQLATFHPDIFEGQVKKYEGRESIMREMVPMLNCRWNDVIHLSLINPQIIYRELVESRLRTGCDKNQIQERQWFEIPYALIKIQPHVFFLNHPEAKRDEGKHLSGDFSICSESQLSQSRDFPEKMRKYYDDQHLCGKMPLLFNWLPHVLVQAPIDISKLNILNWSAGDGMSST